MLFPTLLVIYLQFILIAFPHLSVGMFIFSGNRVIQVLSLRKKNRKQEYESPFKKEISLNRKTLKETLEPFISAPLVNCFLFCLLIRRTKGSNIFFTFKS